MAYRIEGRLLEVCTCNTLCPCWIGDDPDGGTCEGTLAWHIDKGMVGGTDVSGLTFAMLAHIPGNILEGNWKAQAFVDDRATPGQEDALLSVFTGKLGGPIADMAQLIGEVVGVQRVPIGFDVETGTGRLRIGEAVAADLEVARGSDGTPTTLHDTIFSTIPGSPAYVGRAPSYKAKSDALGINVELTGHNAVQGSFVFEA
ncbi:MAG TPA: DUF1326 domain-containing protein [Aromatoleum sp.]|uniref:DUF1326 domain-containing protein n=1 Tax=Aromatoleum sp. TaxID=2307007 RepID=UPI002B487183|nr:DUF1326 domain-containing protein [Aromatoleum sp.]HJV26489.1 DUF1326 domain-containing protein [Aromatoleum sp.]